MHWRRPDGSGTLDVEHVPVATARSDMPGLIRRSAETGRAFLIKNAKNPSAASALLVDPSVLRKKIAEARPPRTLGQVIDSLPYRRLGGNPLLEILPLPNDVLPVIDLPGVDGNISSGSRS